MINISYKFESITTTQQAYWLGFLYADGYIRPNQFVRLCLGIKDREQLVEFAKFMGDNEPIIHEYGPYKTSGKQVHYTIRDKELVANLTKLGCVYKKSLIIRFPDIQSHLRPSFLLGYVDGDGSAGVNDKGSIGISITCGSLEFLNDLKRIFNLNYSIGQKKGKYICYSMHLNRKLLKHAVVITPYSLPRKRLIMETSYKYISDNKIDPLILPREERISYIKYKNILVKNNLRIIERNTKTIKNVSINSLLSNRTKINWPSHDELSKLVANYPLSLLAEYLKVTGNSIKKRCIRYKIPLPVSATFQGCNKLSHQFRRELDEYFKIK